LVSTHPDCTGTHYLTYTLQKASNIERNNKKFNDIYTDWKIDEEPFVKDLGVHE